jgi:mannose-1-phosphate guanylyltransferase
MVIIKSSKENSNCAHKVEKPDLKTAQTYLEQGNYLWNSGMFMLKADMLIDELTTHSSDIVNSVNNAINNARQMSTLSG